LGARAHAKMPVRFACLLALLIRAHASVFDEVTQRDHTEISEENKIGFNCEAKLSPNMNGSCHGMNDQSWTKLKPLVSPFETKQKHMSYLACHNARLAYIKNCYTQQAKIVIRYRGAWSRGPIREDGSWLIVGGASTEVVALKPVEKYRRYQACFDAKRFVSDRENANKLFDDATAAAQVRMCLPALSVTGFKRAGTGTMFEMLERHPDIVPAGPVPETCLTKMSKIWKFFTQLAASTASSEAKYTMTLCHGVTEHLMLYFLFRGPRTLKFVMVRRLPQLLWSRYNVGCDKERESDCGGASGFLAVEGKHTRSPQHFHELLLGSANESVWSKVPTQEELRRFYDRELRQFYWIAYEKVASMVVAAEELLADPVELWKKIQGRFKIIFEEELAQHPEMKAPPKSLPNSNAGKAAGNYQISGFKPLLPESDDYIMSHWTECNDVQIRAAWNWGCSR